MDGQFEVRSEVEVEVDEVGIALGKAKYDGATGGADVMLVLQVRVPVRLRLGDGSEQCSSI